MFVTKGVLLCSVILIVMHEGYRQNNDSFEVVKMGNTKFNIKNVDGWDHVGIIIA